MANREHVDQVVEIVARSETAPAADLGNDLTERVTLPMIPLSYSKHRAVPQYILKILFGEVPEAARTLAPETDEAEAASIFFRAYEDRGPHNEGKKIYFSGVTRDLYRDHYRVKVARFLDRLLRPENEGEGLMGIYQDLYFDLYWDLHLGVRGKAAQGLPTRVGEEFNLVLGLIGSRDENDIRRLVQATRFAAENREELDRWIRGRLDSAPEDSFAYYWLHNGMDRDDVTLEVFHNFLAFSQWGNTLHQTVERLRSDLSSDSEHIGVRKAFRRIMEGGEYDRPDDDHATCPFTPLDRFVMELFRTIAPNDGSLSARPKADQTGSDDDEQIIATHRHKEISHDPLHWPDPEVFNPDRYLGKPLSTEIDHEETERLGFPRCPFEKHDFETREGRRTVVTNDAFGSVYSLHEGRQDPVLEYAGYAPFGFGYRRCPGELLTVEVVKDFLRKVHSEDIEFHKIGFADDDPTLGIQLIPLGVANMVRNDVTFTRSAT